MWKMAATESHTEGGGVGARLHAHTTGYKSELDSKDASDIAGKSQLHTRDAWEPRKTASLFQLGTADSNLNPQASQNLSIQAQALFSEWVEVCLV